MARGLLVFTLGFGWLLGCGGFEGRSPNDSVRRLSSESYEIWAASALVRNGAQHPEPTVHGGVVVSQDEGLSFERPQYFTDPDDFLIIWNSVYWTGGTVINFTIEGFVRRLGEFRLDQWKPVFLDPTLFPIYHSSYFPRAVAIHGEKIAVGSSLYTFLSDDGGDSWRSVNPASSWSSPGLVATQMIYHGDDLFIHNDRVLMKSPDGTGDNFINVDPLRDTLPAYMNRDFRIASNGSRLFLTTEKHGFFISDDSAASWVEIDLNPPISDEEILLDIDVYDQNVLISSNHGIYFSETSGDNFRYFDKTGSDGCEASPSGAVSTYFNVLAYANGKNGFCLSKDYGASWQQVTRQTGLPSNTVTHIEIVPVKN
jgi:hypothetical protein